MRDRLRHHVFPALRPGLGGQRLHPDVGRPGGQCPTAIAVLRHTLALPVPPRGRFPCAGVLTRTDRCPRGQVPGGREHAHVGADFDQDLLTAAADRPRGWCRDGPVPERKGRNSVRAGVEIGDRSVQVVEIDPGSAGPAGHDDRRSGRPGPARGPGCSSTRPGSAGSRNLPIERGFSRFRSVIRATRPNEVMHANRSRPGAEHAGV